MERELSRPAGRSRIERRRSVRQPLVTIGVLFPEAGAVQANAIQVLITDVSLHGVGFRTNLSFEMGQVYHVHIGAGPLHLTSRLRIVAVRHQADGTTMVGGEFF